MKKLGFILQSIMCVFILLISNIFVEVYSATISTTAGTAPTSTAGTAPTSTAGTAPTSTAGTAPTSTAGTAPSSTAGMYNPTSPVMKISPPPSSQTQIGQPGFPASGCVDSGVQGRRCGTEAITFCKLNPDAQNCQTVNETNLVK